MAIAWRRYRGFRHGRSLDGGSRRLAVNIDAERSLRWGFRPFAIKARPAVVREGKENARRQPYSVAPFPLENLLGLSLIRRMGAVFLERLGGA
jgi:hypothetical protein